MDEVLVDVMVMGAEKRFCELLMDLMWCKAYPYDDIEEYDKPLIVEQELIWVRFCLRILIR